MISREYPLYERIAHQVIFVVVEVDAEWFNLPSNAFSIIEYNFLAITCFDSIIDLDSEGSDKGAEIVPTGTSEEPAEHPSSHTACYLR